MAKNHAELQAWAQMPWASDLERHEAFVSAEYSDIRGEAFRQAVAAKDALSMTGAEVAPEMRSQGVTLTVIGEPGKTLEQAAASNPFVAAIRIHDSKFGLSGRDADADAAAVEAAAHANLEASAQQIDAKAAGVGVVWNGHSFVPRT